MPQYDGQEHIEKDMSGIVDWSTVDAYLGLPSCLNGVSQFELSLFGLTPFVLFDSGSLSPIMHLDRDEIPIDWLNQSSTPWHAHEPEVNCKCTEAAVTS